MIKKLSWRVFILLVLFLSVLSFGVRALLKIPEDVFFSKMNCFEIIDGGEQLFSTDMPEILIFGEIHGAKETPQIVGQLVCSAQKKNIPIILAIEYPENKQHDIDVFMNDEGGYTQVEQTLLNSDYWTSAIQDGRRSKAMLELLNTVKFLYSFGLDIRVVAFQPSLDFKKIYPDFSDNELRGLYEKRMANNLLNIQRKPKTKVIVLVGNYHAKRGWYEQRDVSYRLMADYLPTDTAITLNVNSQPGTFWNCQNGECKIHNAGVGLSGVFLKNGDPMLNPAIHLYDERKDGYDGLFYTVTSTASLPAANQEATQ